MRPLQLDCAHVYCERCIGRWYAHRPVVFTSGRAVCLTGPEAMGVGSSGIRRVRCAVRPWSSDGCPVAVSKLRGRGFGLKGGRTRQSFGASAWCRRVHGVLVLYVCFVGRWYQRCCLSNPLWILPPLSPPLVRPHDWPLMTPQIGVGDLRESRVKQVQSASRTHKCFWGTRGPDSHGPTTRLQYHLHPPLPFGVCAVIFFH